MAKFKPQTDPLSEEEIQEQTRFRIEKLKALQAEGKDPYEELTYDVTNHSTEITGDYEAFAGKTVRVAGRLMSKRGMGKVSFCDLYDRRGKIQIFTKIDNLPEEEYQAWQNLDIGDIVGVEGEVYRMVVFVHSPYSLRIEPAHEEGRLFDEHGLCMGIV